MKGGYVQREEGENRKGKAGKGEGRGRKGREGEDPRVYL